jgi:hypothetical protein
MKENKLWMGFEVHTSSGPILQPTRIHYWQKQQFHAEQPEAPFHYKADALVGLSLLQLNQHLQNHFSGNPMFAENAWLALEPHHEMHVRSQPRIQAIQKYFKGTQEHAKQFEGNLTESMASSFNKQGVDFGELTGLIKHIDYLEKQSEQPLLYNFQLQCTKSAAKSLQHLHSLLFNLRALVAMDYNAHVQDPTFEGVRIDSITDYFAKPEYISNDAVLYWKFKKLASQMPEAVAQEMARNFLSYSHNATFLIESLPSGFLKSVSNDNLEDTLYLTQMDWLLGTDAGLLFRVREELYAILDGYEKIFWPELEGKFHQPAHSLSVSCEVSEKDLYLKDAAA